jgi:glycosyl transferase family 61
MRGSVQDADTFRSKVLKISSVDCPPIEQSMVQVLYPRDGVEILRTIIVQRPTYFDQLCTVIVEGTSTTATWPLPPVRSTRDLLRRLYRYAIGMNQKYGLPLRFDKPIFDTRAAEPNNVWHLLFEIIPWCLHAQHCIGPDVSFAFRKLGKPFRELLSVFAIDPIVTDKRIVGPIVQIRGTRGLAGFDLRRAFDCTAISFLPNIYCQYDFKTTVTYDKVFIARRGARSLTNHSDVERLLTAHGYTTVYMEDFSIIDQVSIGAHARHVVAIHGAGMAFLVLNRSVESIIELFPPHVYHAPVGWAAQVRKYILVIQEFDERIVHNGWHAVSYFKDRPFAANLRLLERALAEVEHQGDIGGQGDEQAHGRPQIGLEGDVDAV